MSFSLTSASSPVGPIFIADAGRDGRAAAPARSPEIAALLERAAKRIPVLSEKYTPAALPGEIAKELEPFYDLARNEIDAGTAKRRTTAAAMADHLTIPSTIERTWFAVYVEEIRAMSAAARIPYAHRCGIVPLAAMIDAGRELVGIDEGVWKVVEERARALFYAERAGLAARYPAQPSLDGPLFAIGPDAEAVEAAARVALEGAQASMAELDAEEESLRRIIAVVAVLTAQTPKQVLAKVMGSAEAA